MTANPLTGSSEFAEVYVNQRDIVLDTVLSVLKEIPAPVIQLEGFLGIIDVLISLQHHGDHVHFSLVQDHGRLAPKDLRLKLDPTTLLIAKEIQARR